MELQTIQFNRLVHNDAYRKAERYHNGMKYGEYYTMFKRIQRSLQRLDLAWKSLVNKFKGQHLSKAAEFTTEAN